MSSLQTLTNQLASAAVPYRTDVSMQAYTTLRIGGPAAVLAEPQTQEQLVLCLDLAQACGVPSLVLGRGSNVLFPDEGMDGLVIRTTSMRHVCAQGSRITAECGATLGELALVALKQQLGGLEFSYGIPGTLGGALCMNAGAYGSEIGSLVESVRIYDIQRREVITLDGDQMDFSYRHSALLRAPHWIALSATLALQAGQAQEIDARMREYAAQRQQKQPLELPSAGSAFKRPDGYFAGALIEQSGLKGYRIGGAEVSCKHAGFIVNVGGATAQDVMRLIDHIQKTVYQHHGVMLEPEIQILTRLMAK